MKRTLRVDTYCSVILKKNEEYPEEIDIYLYHISLFTFAVTTLSNSHSGNNNF